MAQPAEHRAELSRRRALRFVLCGTALLLGSGHAPYGQWGAYRKRHLLILTTRADPASFELGERLAAVLADKLPESRAQVTRAPHNARLASLISTEQMDLAVMRADDAAALLEGAAPFAEYGPVPLRTVVDFGHYLLVCREDFPARHAWLIAEAVSKARSALPMTPSVPAVGSEARVRLHPGSEVYFAGGPLPDRQIGEDHEHSHERKPERPSSAG